MTSPPLSRRAHRPSLVDIAYDAITEAIFDGRIEAGARLRIDAVAAQLGMSITPVREALARTTAVGLTRLDANRGHTVTPVLNAEEYHQLFAARRTIECAAVRGSGRRVAAWVSRLPSEEIVSLRTHLDEMTRAGHSARYADYSHFMRLDNELHRRLIQLAGNPFFVTAFDSLNFHLSMSRLYRDVGVVDFDVAQAEHTAIVDALEHGDGPAVGRACDTHIRLAHDRLLPLLGKNKSAQTQEGARP